MKQTPLLLFFLLAGTALYSNKALLPGHNAPDNAKDVTAKITYKFSVKGHLDSIRIKMIVPHSIKNRQTVNDISFEPQPDSIYERNGNSYVLFKLYGLDDNFSISMKANITIYKLIPGTNENPDSSLNKYLRAEPFIQKDDPDIVAAAAVSKKKTDIETVIGTFKYVKEHISYEQNKPVGADSVLSAGVGRCMDFSDLFNALLRANNIPAKSVYGLTLHDDGDPGFHAWSEVYLKKQGWILFDPTSGHSDVYRDGDNYKMKIANKYVILSEGRNDPELKLQLMRYKYAAATGATVKVKRSATLYAD